MDIAVWLLPKQEGGHVPASTSPIEQVKVGTALVAENLVHGVLSPDARPASLHSPCTDCSQALPDCTYRYVLSTSPRKCILLEDKYLPYLCLAECSFCGGCRKNDREKMLISKDESYDEDVGELLTSLLPS